MKLSEFCSKGSTRFVCTLLLILGMMAYQDYLVKQEEPIAENKIIAIKEATQDILILDSDETLNEKISFFGSARSMTGTFRGKTSLKTALIVDFYRKQLLELGWSDFEYQKISSMNNNTYLDMYTFKKALFKLDILFHSRKDGVQPYSITIFY